MIRSSQVRLLYIGKLEGVGEERGRTRVGEGTRGKGDLEGEAIKLC